MPRRCAKYGTDKPDLRNPIEMQDVTEHFRGSGFKVFARHDRDGPEGRGVGDPGAGRRHPRLLRPHERAGRRARASRASATSSGARARQSGAGSARQATSAPERDRAAMRRLSSASSDGRRGVLRRRQAAEVLQVRRRRPAPRSARSSNLIDEDRFEFCWIVDFPMYEWNEEEKKIDFSHNPFSMPNMGGRFAALEAADEQTRICSALKAYPVRHRLQRRGAVVRARSATTCPT